MKIYLTITFVCLVYGVFGQSITSDVINTSGGHYSQGGYRLSTNIGEVVSTFYSKSSGILNVGFLQNFGAFTAEIPRENINYNLSIYPNPVSDVLRIGGNEGEINFEILDQTGKIVSRGISSNCTIPISELTAGMYYLKLDSAKKSEQSIKTFIKL